MTSNSIECNFSVPFGTTPVQTRASGNLCECPNGEAIRLLRRFARQPDLWRDPMMHKKKYYQLSCLLHRKFRFGNGYMVETGHNHPFIWVGNQTQLCIHSRPVTFLTYTGSGGKYYRVVLINQRTAIPSLGIQKSFTSF